MSSRKVRTIAVLCLAGLLVAAAGIALKAKTGSGPQAADTRELWKKVDKAEHDGLPQTAVDVLKQIVAASRAGKHSGEFLRALTRQIILESVIKGNKPEFRVDRLQEEIGRAPAELRPVMKLILAQWYWQYYSRNKWRFMDRSRTEGLDEKDFTTWDLPKLFGKIDGLYRDVLKDAARLKTEPFSGYADFLVAGNVPPAYRPTLYDFAVFEALDFYTSAEQSAVQPEDAFEIPADSPALGPLADFLKYAPQTTDEGSAKLQALKLYQAVIAFHLEKGNREAAIDDDLGRLRYMNGVAVGEGASERYLERLAAIVKETGPSPLQSLAYYDWAEELYGRDDLVGAFRIAGLGAASSPSSISAGNCRVLQARITAKEFDLRSESVLRPGQPGKLAVGYRNVTALHLRLVKQDFSVLMTGPKVENLFWMSDEAVRSSISKPAAAQWSATLAPTIDYKKREALVDVPALSPGFYWLLASLDPHFAWNPGNKIQRAAVWVSELGLVTAARAGEVEGFTVLSASGRPVPGTSVTLYRWDYDQRALVQLASGSTDEQGAFDLGRADISYNSLLVARTAQGAEIAQVNIPRSYARPLTPSERTLFFTDRSLYRPGQMIFFKGICLGIDQGRNDYRLLTRRRVHVTLLDPNRQEVASLDLVTNAFGSFSGSFTAPADRLAGAMTISTQNPAGGATVRVEEYKRPKFQVKLDVPDREFRLNDTVAVPGEAMAYTGAPIDGAAVKFRVVRRVQYPWWWYNWYGEQGKSQEIAHGVLRTDANGKFEVVFKARPDASVPAKSGPTFTYSITADVTDSTGETRSADGSVRLGYTSLEASLSCDEWQEKGKPVSIEIGTSTLNGKKIAAKGEVEIHRLDGPAKPVPADLIGEVAIREKAAAGGSPTMGFKETPDWRKWPEGSVVARKEFETSAKEDVRTRLSFDLDRGVYKARLKTKDRYGNAVESLLYLMVLDPRAETFGVKVPFYAAARSTRVEVGQTFEALWGTGYEEGPVLIEVYQNDRRLSRVWSPKGLTEGLIKVPVDEKLRGGFTVIVSLVKDNRLYRDPTRVEVPWTNKQLTLAWQTFRSKLRPGQEETWSLKIAGSDAAVRAAEMVATLYDDSLDQFYGHSFPNFAGVFRTEWTSISSAFSNAGLNLRTVYDRLNPSMSFTGRVYVHFPPDITENVWGYGYPHMVRYAAKNERAGAVAEEAMPAPMAAPQAADQEKSVVGGVVGGVLGGVSGETGAPKERLAQPDLSKVTARKNLNETAFFFPHLLTDKNGVVTIEFKMPEALTEWRFLSFAHTKDLESSSLTDTAVTQKELMVQPNPPRFLREGDAIEFTVKVTNMTEAEASGAVELTFFDPRTDKPLDAALANAKTKLSFAIPAKQSRSFSWPIRVPDKLDLAGFKAVAATAKFSDGEEGVLPVLSRRIFVQEAIPLWISNKGEKTFRFEKLLKSGSSSTLENISLTVQMASNPAWYAIQALPFLMEFPYECSEQVFNRLYANALAQNIADSSPKIRRIFDLWKGTSALQSNLEKNQDLKSVLLQESPWVLEAKAETQAKQNVGLLFDENRMRGELAGALLKLQMMQLSDGSWPWFPGGRGNEYITLYILTGFGRLKHLGVASVPQDMALKALGRLDAWINEIYREILKAGDANLNHLTSTIAFYLYGRSFYLAERPIPKSSREAVDYFLKQGARFWLDLGWRQSQAHLALALNRFGDKVTAQKIMRSMKERSQVDEEMGRFWSDLELSWWWFRAPIETQAVMIEAFDEVMNDEKAVEECKVWLLKQKQTQDWKTTKATADAVYALILKGTDLLASNEIVAVSLGGKTVEPEKIEAGTGFYEKRFGPEAVRPEMGDIVVRKSDPGIAWGGVHWQYLEDISKVTEHVQGPLKLKKSVFVERQTKKGPAIEPVTGPLAVGDTLVIRIELRTDRDMEYVHMKDYRGSGLEPTNVLSQYKYQGGLIYYESTKDAATHFFIDYLPKGTYVFEYRLRVQLRGSYQNGMAQIECMYAPEFNSHSDSVGLVVK
jgi:uncharacterized protein YfaS (alpha-2-macroglobulin family)